MRALGYLAAAIVGAVILMVLLRASGIQPRVKEDISFADFTVVVLSALGVMVAILTFFLGVLAFFGWSAFRTIIEDKFEELFRRVLNDVEIVFGDWASTRPPPIDSVIRRGFPRLDMPTRVGWECWRSQTSAGTYAELASNVARDRGLRAMSDLWGEQLIIATRDGGEPAVKSPTTATAVRINLHMVTQAHFDTGGPQVSDELVVGEL
jgi:hypothetical protein